MKQNKIKIRTLTGFISVNDFSKFNKLESDLLFLKSEYEKAGCEVQTIRITTDIVEQINELDQLKKYEKFLDTLESNGNISLYHLGPITKLKLFKKIKHREIVSFLLKHKKAFLTVDASNQKESYDLCLQGARICKMIAEYNSFECRRFALYASLNESTPFYPASRIFSNSMKYSIGAQCADLAVDEARLAKKDMVLFEKNLKKRMEKEFSALEKIMPAKIKKKFIGFDTSLAPFPKSISSIANAIEIVLGKPFGSSGTLSVCRILTRVMKENRIKKTGLCGLMLPVVEDNILAKRGIEGRYNLNNLLLYSSVCATGLDTIPISGRISEKDLADCYFDLVSLSKKLQKPLSARFFIEPNKLAGEIVEYDWKYACESPVFKV